MAKVMFTFDAPQPLTLEAVKARFGLADEEIDPSFGVIEVDPESHSYTILVEESAGARIRGQAPEVRGPFSNPKIAPFGPPEGSSGPKR
jgi:hypothetical protein